MAALNDLLKKKAPIEEEDEDDFNTFLDKLNANRNNYMRESREKLYFEIDEATGHVKSLAEITEREREEPTVKKVDRSQVSHASSRRYADNDSDEENTA